MHVFGLWEIYTKGGHSIFFFFFTFPPPRNWSNIGHLLQKIKWTIKELEYEDIIN